MKTIKIAIDGPSGSGKSTTAKLLAKKLDYLYLDTGAMYRAVGLAWLKEKVEANNENLSEILNRYNFDFHFHPENLIVKINDEDVTSKIRTQEVSDAASLVSSFQPVREKLVDMQRKMAEKHGAILDGRDIGTVVFPDAELKIYLVASIESRAERRYKELKLKGQDVDLDEIKKKLLERDLFDSTRKISPLKKADDAVEIDTTGLTITGQVNKVYELANRIINS